MDTITPFDKAIKEHEEEEEELTLEYDNPMEDFLNK